jgi:hypothetical protein
MNNSKMTHVLALVGAIALNLGSANAASVSQAAYVVKGNHAIKIVYAKVGFKTDTHTLTAAGKMAGAFKHEVGVALDRMSPVALESLYGKSILIVGDIREANGQVAGFTCSKCADKVIVLSMAPYVTLAERNPGNASIVTRAIQTQVDKASKQKGKIVSKKRKGNKAALNLCDLLDPGFSETNVAAAAAESNASDPAPVASEPSAEGEQSAEDVPAANDAEDEEASVFGSEEDTAQQAPTSKPPVAPTEKPTSKPIESPDAIDD